MMVLCELRDAAAEKQSQLSIYCHTVSQTRTSRSLTSAAPQPHVPSSWENTYTVILILKYVILTPADLQGKLQITNILCIVL